MKPKIVVITSGFPRCSETFALGEILALEERGLLEAIFATKPGDGSKQPGCERIMKRLRILPQSTSEEQAAIVVKSLRGQTVAGIHGYFAHLPADVASKAATQIGVPFGFSTHARDARKVSKGELAQRARNAVCVVACNSDVAQEVRECSANIRLMPHGVDLQRFRPRPVLAENPLRILAVGRLVEKKGFDILIAALSQVSFPFQLRIIGEGPQRNLLEDLIAATGLTKQITLCGMKTHEELPEEYANAHVVVVPSVIDSTGDRDGLPNVILEAMASERAVIASDVSAIKSAVAHNETGILVQSGDPVRLADAIKQIACDISLRVEISRNARKRVERDFEAGQCKKRFCDLLESVYA
jgi:glycosyltransferase involved in cell wall biosynthesis